MNNETLLIVVSVVVTLGGMGLMTWLGYELGALLARQMQANRMNNRFRSIVRESLNDQGAE